MRNPFSYIKTALFQFSISTQFSSIWPINKTLSNATTLGQSEPGNNGNEGVLRIPQSSCITGTWPSDSVISKILLGGVLPLCREAVDVFYSPNLLGNHWMRTNQYIYIYIHILLSTEDCFIVSQLFSVDKHASCYKLGSKPCWLYVRYLTPETLPFSVLVKELFFF